jgi:translocation and assembly module TamA
MTGTKKYIYYNGFRHALRCLILMVLASLCLCTGAQASWWWPFGEKGIGYTVTITGIDKDTNKAVDTYDVKTSTSAHPPKTLTELDQEGVALGSRLLRLLHARGYFDAVTEYHLDKNAHPAALVYAVTPGKRYHITAIRLDWQGGVVKKIDPAAFPIHVGDAVDAAAIDTYGATLETVIGKDACLLSLSVTPELELHGKTATAVLVYHIAHGPHALFGPVTITGNQKVDAAAIRRSIGFKQGKCFTQAAIAKTQTSLIGTQLFGSVKISHGNTVDAKGEVPMTVEVKERVERTVSAGVNYATDQGFGTKFGWEHRNFGGDGEKLDVNAVLAQQEQSLGATDRIGGFLRDDQTLNLSASIDHQDTDAYISQDLNMSALLERKLSPTLNSGAGLAYLLTRDKDQLTGEQNFGLVSTPLFLEYDTRDNAQDAHKGLFLHGGVTPYVDTFDLSTDFFKFDLTGQTYFSSDIIGKPTLALRGSFGSLAGASSASLPADLRFYAGGGGSVRGYSYQSLSPHYDGTPVGGGSLLEFESELRVRFSESFGGVVFLDGGNAYVDNVPTLNSLLYYGAGIGARYYSALGPLRLDIGFPLNGRNIDNSGDNETNLQFYVSIGQAF